MSDKLLTSAEQILRYISPAKSWSAALPLGNGRLGAMVWGGIKDAFFDLNEETLWSGALQQSWNNPGAKDILPQIRQAVAARNYLEANELCYKIQGIFGQSYMPMGRLSISHALPDTEHSGYERQLNILDGVHQTVFDCGGMRVVRESFISAPAGIMVVQVRSSKPLCTQIRLNSQLRHQVICVEGNILRMEGQSPSHVVKEGLDAEGEPIIYDQENPGLRFCTELQVECDNGHAVAANGVIDVVNSNCFTLLLAAATNFAGPDVKPAESSVNPVELVRRKLEPASATGFLKLKKSHMDDFRALMGRVELKLASAPQTAEMPTDERLKLYRKNEDPGLAALLFQYGRYLLVSSSRPGSLPATLQGIWNDQLRPAWMSNWTMDQNIQMTYWASWTTNLPECEDPYLRFIDDLRPHGRETARVNYGVGGWVCHNTVDLWMQTAPAGIEEPRWCILPLGGVWSCQHLWMHYLFYGDRAWLADYAYPIMKEAAEFCLDWLIDDGTGHLTTCPSVSPENWFMVEDGKRLAVSHGCTFDMQVIGEHFDHCIAAAELLGIDGDFANKLRVCRERLIPPQIGRFGQLQEWVEDLDSPGDRHRHISHLYGLFPGDTLTPSKTPLLWQAAAVSLAHRVDGNGEAPAGKNDPDTGWSLAWKIGWWARLHDSERVRESLLKMLIPCLPEYDYPGGRGGLYPSLLNASPPFTMEGNMGLTAGIAESLLQSHDGVLHVLPAVPRNWTEGRVTGLRARGGIQVDIMWDTQKIKVICHGKELDNLVVMYNDRLYYSPTQAEDGKIEVDITR